MFDLKRIYCLDTNVLIQAWQQFNSPILCKEYWNILNELGDKKKIFLAEAVAEEIIRKDDSLSKWLKNSNIPVQKIDNEVISKWQEIQDANPLHKFLVDNIRQRSLADPWVITHSMKMNATVVTRENKETAPNSKRIKISNVCENMNIRCINDFVFLKEIGIRFSCYLIE